MRNVETYTFSGIENFRDFGGVATADGGRLKPGRLFRSAHHGGATEDDLAALHALGVGVVADLRRPAERRSHPSRRHPDFAGEVIESELGDREEGPHVEFLRTGDLSDDGVEAYLLGYYRTAFFQPQHVELFGRAVNALIDRDEAIVIHCTAGKDRTGLLAGLIQHALGVHADDVMEDFMATNAVTMVEPRMSTTAGRLEAMTGRKTTPAILRGFMGVSAQHLDAAFEALESEAGGADGYLARLGVDARRKARLRERLLA